MGWWPCSILGSGPADVCRGNSNLHSNRHVCAHLWCLTCRGSKLRKSGAKSLHILCQVCVEVLGQLLLWYLQSLWLSISVKGTQPAPVLRPYLEWIMSLSEPHISVLKILCVCNEWSLYWHCSENVCTFVTQHVPINCKTWWGNAWVPMLKHARERGRRGRKSMFEHLCLKRQHHRPSVQLS